MASVTRILAATALVAVLAVLAVHSQPRWLSSHVDSARAQQDPWREYLAPESTCPGRERTDTADVAQNQVMICLLWYARASEGLPALPDVYLLNRSALLKATDIVRCADFSHTACGKPFPSVFAEAGYRGRAVTSEGENIAWGGGAAGSPLAVVSGWLNSPHHRENLFSRDWREQGIALVQVPSFLGARDVQVWVSEFGARS